MRCISEFRLLLVCSFIVFLFSLTGCQLFQEDEEMEHVSILYSLGLESNQQTVVSNSQVNITWKSFPGVTAVNLYYSIDGGDWITIALNETNNQIHEWTVPYAHSTNVRLRIDSVDDDRDTATSAAIEIASNLWYVDGSVTASGNGLTWGTAFKTIAEAAGPDGVALAGSDVWVAQGTYTETEYASSNAANHIVNVPEGVGLYGGFASGDAWEDRSPSTKETILDANYSYSNVIIGDVSVLDGFSITHATHSGIDMVDTDAEQTIEIRNCSFIENGQVGSNSRGGAIGIWWISSSPVQIMNCTFTDNYSDLYGGAVYTDWVTYGVLFSGCTFTGNESLESGGAIYSSAAKIEFTNCDFTSNTSAYAGGAIATQYDISNVIIDDCSFASNISQNTGGGAAYIAGENLLVTNSDFANNTAELIGGGAIYSSAHELTVIGCIFRGNMTSSDSIFIEQGGAIRHDNGPFHIIESEFYNNNAENGGALSISYSYSVISGSIENSLFVGNSASEYYGALDIYINSESTVDINNCIIQGNTAPNKASFVLSTGTYSINNCTITNNTATEDNGGVYFYNSTGTINNSIIWGNTDSSGNSHVYGNNSAITINRSNISGGATALLSLATAYTCTGMKSESPDFTDPDGADNIMGTSDDDLSLQSTSTCIDAGYNEYVPADALDLDGDGNLTEPVPYDVLGNPRMIDVSSIADTGTGTAPIVDMGAVEYQ